MAIPAEAAAAEGTSPVLGRRRLEACLDAEDQPVAVKAASFSSKKESSTSQDVAAALQIPADAAVASQVSTGSAKGKQKAQNQPMLAEYIEGAGDSSAVPTSSGEALSFAGPRTTLSQLC